MCLLRTSTLVVDFSSFSLCFIVFSQLFTSISFSRNGVLSTRSLISSCFCIPDIIAKMQNHARHWLCFDVYRCANWHLWVVCELRGVNGAQFNTFLEKKCWPMDRQMVQNQCCSTVANLLRLRKNWHNFLSATAHFTSHTNLLTKQTLYNFQLSSSFKPFIDIENPLTLCHCDKAVRCVNN